MSLLNVEVVLFLNVAGFCEGFLRRVQSGVLDALLNVLMMKVLFESGSSS